MARVLITGCSSGFGRLAAEELARRGHQVYAGLHKPGTASPAGAHESIRWVELDVTDAAAIDRAVAQIMSETGGIDMLVNNAGIAAPGALEDLDADVLHKVMATNFFGALSLTRAVLPIMRSQGEGRILMLSSLSARVGLPGEGIYAASKAALEAAAESLRFEVDRFGIQVCVIEPGAFATGMPARIAAAGTGPAGSPYQPLLEHLLDRARAEQGSGDDPQRVADLIAELAEAGELQFRYPVGQQAEQVIGALKELDETARARFIQSVNDTSWWSSGADKAEGEG